IGFNASENSFVLVAPDSAHLAIADILDVNAPLSIVDLASHHKTVLAVGTVDTLAWRDAAHVLTAAGEELRETDIATGVTRRRTLGSRIQRVAADPKGPI